MRNNFKFQIMESRNAQNLAERITPSFRENGSDNFLHSSLEKINRRLDEIESNIASQNPESKTKNPKLNHSSQEKFTDLEELADEIINGLLNEKACPFEPAGKPCDHCAMCNSRGF